MNHSDQSVYLIVGDGELNEGQCWEAFQFIAHNKLNNCLVFIDDNKKQLDGTTESIMNPFDITEKMNAFGFNAVKVKGNDLQAIDEAINNAKLVTNQASCIVLDNIKGSGVKFFEEMDANHSVKFGAEDIDNATDAAIAHFEAIVNGGK